MYGEYVGPKRDAGIGDWRKLRKMRTCMVCASQKSILGDKIKKNVMGGACFTHGRDEVYSVFWLEKL